MPMVIRTGPDGWKPKSVKIYGYNSKAVTFYVVVLLLKMLWTVSQQLLNTLQQNKKNNKIWNLFSGEAEAPTGRDQEENNQQNLPI
ncbi:hypothetical protein F8388_008978 [Cannabis sativa]|uniref:Uncharacterized protein n=1 Tax=Cannabis sativa TaxID=3483 RepID=A0A7J6GG24_CANSA|nr:hypothetical protein F8388_008978 [Cannabis sativa]